MNWPFITKMSSPKKRDVLTLSLPKYKTKVSMEPPAIHDQKEALILKTKQA